MEPDLNFGVDIRNEARAERDVEIIAHIEQRIEKLRASPLDFFERQQELGFLLAWLTGENYV